MPVRRSRYTSAHFVVVTASVLVTVLGTVVVTAPGAEARRGAHCGMLIKRDLTLHRSLHHCRGDGLVVVADNVTVNLRGHTVGGRGRRGTVGIRVAGHDGVVIRRGTIRRFGMGILLTDAQRVRILRNTITGSFDEGIFTDENSEHLVIGRNRISGSGIRSGATWADGIDVRGDAVQVRSNRVLHNRDDGIDVNGTDLTVQGNRVIRNGRQGIDVDGHDVLVRNNAAKRNGGDGIGVSVHAHGVTISRNLATFNGDLGVQARDGTAVHGGSNRARRNRDSRQCVPMICAA